MSGSESSPFDKGCRLCMSDSPDPGCRLLCVCPMASGCGLLPHTHTHTYLGVCSVHTHYSLPNI